MAATTRPTSLLRLYWVPSLLLVLILLTNGLLALWEWADWDLRIVGKLKLLGVSLILLAPVVLSLWLIFTPLLWKTKQILIGVTIVLTALLIATIDDYDVTGNLGVIFHYRWQPRQQLAQHRADQHENPAELPAIDLTIDPADSYPRYRGQDGTGTIKGVVVDPDWQTNPPREIWRQPVGGGYGGFAVAGNVLVTLEQRQEDEAVVCYDRASGRERWVYRYPASFRDPTGNGPRATPTIDQEEVFSLGATGWLVCLDGKTGGLKWKVNILADNGAKLIVWGMSGSPLVVGNKVILNAGIDSARNLGKALVAYDRQTGTPIWAAGRHPAGYSSPQLAKLCGHIQVLLFDGGGLAGFDLETGEELWRYPWTTFANMNISQPVVIGDQVFIGSEPSNGGAMVQISRQGDTWSAEKVWANHFLAAKYGNPVTANGYLYGLSNGWLVCVDSQTGQRRWRGKHYGHGQVLLVENQLLIGSEKGELALVETNAEEFREQARVSVFKDRTWNTPALAGRHLYWRNEVEMVCYQLPVLSGR